MRIACNAFGLKYCRLLFRMESMLKGKKTFICCGLAALAALAAAFEYVDGESAEFQALLTCLFAGAGISLRLGVKNGG